MKTLTVCLAKVESNLSRCLRWR